MLQRLIQYYGAGSFASLALAIVMWILGRADLHDAIGVDLEPKLTLEWVISQMVFGGIAGFLFIIPFKFEGFKKVALIALFPALFMWFYVFPQIHGDGYFGLDEGNLMPLVEYLYQLAWAAIAAAFMKGGRS
ncbi:MAG: hypothetical protein MK193_08920 [Lentisphaeria bacterium]|nr:hypothetical protein [Lentisphaeria bacterium]